MDTSYIERQYLAVREDIAKLAARLGLPEATLVCVTKSGTDEEILALAGYGASEMAENRPQELARRAALLRDAGFAPRMHEIGNLQKNKVRLILGKTALIHSVDSLSLAAQIDRLAQAAGEKVSVLLEINSAREPNKGGVLPEDAFALYESVRPLSHLRLCGLMTMGPAVDNPEDVRPYLRATKKLFDEIQNRYGYDTPAPVLSMGMSGSYAVAIEEGSTLVRVGRRLFTR